MRAFGATSADRAPTGSTTFAPFAPRGSRMICLPCEGPNGTPLRGPLHVSNAVHARRRTPVLTPRDVVRLLLVRHGESEGNRAREFSRDNDVRLTETGMEQARAAGRRIALQFAPTRLVASPYDRTRHTARLLAETLGYAGDIEFEPALREREIGELAGAPYEAMRAHREYDPAAWWEWRPDGGESLVDVVHRAAPVVDALLVEGQQTVVVSHGGVMLALRAHIDGHWEHFAVSRNCEILAVVADADGRLRVESLEESNGGPAGGGATG